MVDGSADTLVLQAGGTIAGFTVGDDDALDLHGQDVVVNGGIALATGVTFRIEDSVGGGSLSVSAVGNIEAGIDTTGATLIIDSGHIVVQGGQNSAGIGSTVGRDAGTVIINGGTVESTGGTLGGAGIGGGRANSSTGTGSGAGTITITGGTVTAEGTNGGAGIGGGYWGMTPVISNGGTVTISGGTVTAVGSAWTGGATLEAAGIGGGARGSGGSVSISGAAVVTARAAGLNFADAVGRGSGGPTLFGSLSVDDTSRLNLGSTTTVPSGVTVAGTGTIGGTGWIINSGIILPIVDHSDGLTVTVRHFVTNFDLNYPGAPAGPVTHVYAPTYAEGARAFPADPARAGFTFSQWNAIPGGGGPVYTSASPATTWTVYAIWAPITPVVSGPATAAAGATTTYTVDQGGDDTTADFTFTTDDPSDVITGDQIVFRNPGPRVVTATSDFSSSVSDTFSTDVVLGAPAAIILTPDATSVNQGGSVTFTATAEDAAGNSLGDVTSSVVLTSDVATDVISGATVTFPHASPHTITAAMGAVRGSVVIQVTPAAASGPLASTGAVIGGSVALAVLLLLGGLALRLRSPRGSLSNVEGRTGIEPA